MAAIVPIIKLITMSCRLLVDTYRLALERLNIEHALAVLTPCHKKRQDPASAQGQTISRSDTFVGTESTESRLNIDRKNQVSPLDTY